MPTDSVKHENALKKPRDKKRREFTEKAPLKTVPAVSNGVGQDMPNNLTVNSVVDTKGHETGHLLVRAKGHADKPVQALLATSELALGRFDSLTHFAVEAKLKGYMSPKGLRTLAAILLDCEAKPVFVVLREGFHCFQNQGMRYGLYVLGQTVHYFGPKPPMEVVLLTKSGSKEPPSGSLESWHRAIGVHMAGNPNMVVSVLAALAPGAARPFGLTVPILAIVAPSSTGKTTLQQVALSTFQCADKIEDASGTTKGLRVMMESHPNQPVCLQDFHMAEDRSGSMELLFGVGNSGSRVTSTSDQKVQTSAELSCGLILSMEMLFMEMLGNSKIALPEGFSARCFEMVLQGPHGAFHKLPEGVEAHQFSNQLKRACAEHYGAVWEAWIPAIASNAEQISQWLPEKLQEAEKLLLDGLEVKDSVTLRLVGAMAAWVVVGWLATKFGVIKLKRATVTESVRLVLREHLQRQAHRTTPIGEKVISTVRDYIDRNASRFPALIMFGRNDQSNILGYVRGTGKDSVFLFLPGVFEDLLDKKFGRQMALQKLHEAGYLIKDKEGWQKLVRVDDEQRKRFYAIRSSICFDGEAVRTKGGHD